MLAAGSEDAVAIVGGHVQMRGSALLKQAHALLAQVEAVGLAAPLLARPHVVPQLAEVEQQALHVVVVHCDGVIMICAAPLEIIFLAHDEVLWVDIERSHQVQPLLHTHLVQPLLQLKHLAALPFREEELLYGNITLVSLLGHRLNRALSVKHIHERQSLFDSSISRAMRSLIENRCTRVLLSV